MILEDFINMAIDDMFYCYIWDCNKDEIVYEGMLCEIPYELLEKECSSWEINDGKIEFNIV